MLDGGEPGGQAMRVRVQAQQTRLAHQARARGQEAQRQLAKMRGVERDMILEEKRQTVREMQLRQEYQRMHDELKLRLKAPAQAPSGDLHHLPGARPRR